MKRVFQSATSVLLVLNLNSTIPPARGQNTVFTYQGHVLDNGTNFTGKRGMAEDEQILVRRRT